MNQVFGRPRTPRERERAEAEWILREQVVEEAAGRFACPLWRLVHNSPACRVFGVGHGLYPDLVALDGSDVGTAWVLEAATPSTVGDETSWERWHQIASTGLTLILAVPPGSGRVVERLAAMIGMKVGLVYEYALTEEGVAFNLPRPEAGRGAH